MTTLHQFADKRRERFDLCMNSSIVHDNTCSLIHKCHLKSYRSDIKYHLTSNIIFSVPKHDQREHLTVKCGVPEGAGSNVSKHQWRLRGESSRKTIISLHPTVKNVQQSLTYIIGDHTG